MENLEENLFNEKEDNFPTVSSTKSNLGCTNKSKGLNNIYNF